jgi:NADH dehydrogenase
VGAGFGGLNVAKDLIKGRRGSGLLDVRAPLTAGPSRPLGPIRRDGPVDVLVVDANNFHTFQPLLYQVATAGLGEDDIAQPVRRVVASHRAVSVLLGRVDAVDLERRMVHTAEGDELFYEHLVLAPGAVTADFGIPGVREHSYGLKTLADALKARNHILSCFEEANRIALKADEPEEGLLTFVVAGGGPTGVEVAGALVELRDRVLAREFRDVDARRARVVLVEATDHLLAPFHARLRERARRVLESRGVEVRLRTAIEQVSADRVRLAGGEELAARTVIWAAGVRGHPLGAALGVSLARGGRVPVDSDLRLAGHPEVRVIGDLAAVDDGHDQLLPQLAPVAMQQAHHVAASILADVAGSRPPRPFRYHDRGMMATIGRSEGIAQLRYNVRFSGFPGWVAWLALHLVMLMGFRSRANVLLNWAWSYLTYDRGARLILESG